MTASPQLPSEPVEARRLGQLQSVGWFSLLVVGVAAIGAKLAAPFIYMLF
jgi:hypothetical protein